MFKKPPSLCVCGLCVLLVVDAPAVWYTPLLLQLHLRLLPIPPSYPLR